MSRNRQIVQFPEFGQSLMILPPRPGVGALSGICDWHSRFLRLVFLRKPVVSLDVKRCSVSLDFPRSSQFSVRNFFIGLLLSWYLVMKNIGVSVAGWLCDCIKASLRVFVLSYLESI